MPLLNPLQIGLDAFEMETVKGVEGSLIIAFAEATQPLLSVTLMV